MRIAYFNCFSGISGDMILGALIDAGLDPQKLIDRLKALPLTGYQLEFIKVKKHGIGGTKVNVLTEESHPHRGLKDIYDILEKSSLPEKTIEKVKNIFLTLAQAEAKVHHTQPEEIHFHEVGAVDAIIDIVGAVIGIEELGIEEIYASPLNVGSGFVQCAHGLMPVPAPATIEILKGVPIYSQGAKSELVTPTGAAIIKTLAKDFGSLPEFVVEHSGYGAGQRNLDIPNLLQIIIGKKKKKPENLQSKTFTMIETNIDDMNPELYPYLSDKLYQLGALEVYLCPAQMKKNRPGTILHVIVPKEQEITVVKAIFEETTTIGVRFYPIQRYELAREITHLKTKYGTIRIKVSKWGEKILNASPEYEDCRQAALKANVPLKLVYEESKALFYKKQNKRQ